MFFVQIYLSYLSLAVVGELSANKRAAMLACLGCSLFIAFVFAARQDMLLSADWPQYVNQYNEVPKSFSELNWQRIEPGYMVTMWLGQLLSLSPVVFLMLISLLAGLLLFVVSQLGLGRSPIVLVLLTLSPYSYNFLGNLVRQGLAFVAILFLVFVIQKKSRPILWVVVGIIAISFHFSAIFPLSILYLSNSVDLTKGSLKMIFVIALSPLLFFLNFTNVIASGLELLPLPGALARSIPLALAAQDSVIVTGRVFYLIAYLLVLFVMIRAAMRKPITSDGNVLSGASYNNLLSLIAVSVCIYPVLADFGYFIRVSGYGLALVPLFCYVTFCSKRNSSFLIPLSVSYAIVFMFYSRNLLLV